MSFEQLSKRERIVLAGRLKAARNLAGCTVRGVAASLGVNPNSVTQWEHGSVPGPDTRAKLAVLYAVDEDVLFAEVAARKAAAADKLRPPA